MKIITAKMTKKAQKQEKVGKSGKKWENAKQKSHRRNPVVPRV